MFHSFLFYSWFRGWRLLIGVCLCLLAGQSAQAQVPAWQTAILSSPDRGNQSGLDAIASDANGNVYIAGTFLGTIRIGNISLTSVGDVDMFVAKWSSATGSYVWAQRGGGQKSDFINGIGVSGGNVYVTGAFYGSTATFGSTTLLNADVNAHSSDVFVAKLTETDGSFIWAQRAGGTDGDGPAALAATSSGVYITGTFASATADFGAITVRNTSTTFGHSSDVFVAKLTDVGSTGTFSWALDAGGDMQDGANAIAVQGTSVYVAGIYRSRTVTFGNVVLPNLSAGSFSCDAFVAKLTDAGTSARFTWAQRVGGEYDDYAYGVAASNGNVYLTGTFTSSTCTLGSLTLTTTAYYTATFVAKLTDAGSTSRFVWAQQNTGTKEDVSAYAIAADGANVYIAGRFISPTAQLGSTTLVAVGPPDIFVAKLLDAGSTGSFAWARQAGGPNFDQATAVAVAGKQVYVGGLITNQASFGSLTLTTGGGNGFLAQLTDNAAAATPVTVHITRPTLPPLSCARDTTLTLSANLPGGTWSGRGITNAQAGTFRSGVAGPGRHLLTYSVANVGQDTLSLVVRPVAVKVLTAPATLCRLDTLVRLAATPAGGTWRGPGLSSTQPGVFSGAVAGPGRHMLRYELGSGACRVADSVALVISPVAIPVLSPAGPLTLRCGQADQLLSVASAAASGTSYTWQYAARSGAPWQNLPSAGNQPTYRATQAGRYRVQATQDNCFAVSTPVELRIEPMQAVFVPTIFTPNHDGVNDAFELNLQYPRTFHLQVFNRWGREVFRTDTYGEFWKGQDASAGVYFYLWRYSTDCEPTEQTVKGAITVAP